MVEGRRRRRIQMANGRRCRRRSITMAEGPRRRTPSTVGTPPRMGVEGSAWRTAEGSGRPTAAFDGKGRTPAMRNGGGGGGGEGFSGNVETGQRSWLYRRVGRLRWGEVSFWETSEFTTITTESKTYIAQVAQHLSLADALRQKGQRKERSTAGASVF